MRAVFFVLAACLLAACSSGRDFARPTMATISPGVATEQSVVGQFGTPQQRRQQIAPVPSPEQVATARSGFDSMPVEGAYVRLDYDYSKSDGFGGTSHKNLFFIFWNDRLVAYDLISDMEGASTKFDESRIAALRRGVTTKQQVIELLGEPSGQAIYPMVKDKGNQLLSYSFVGIGRSQFYTGQRDISISFLQVLIGPDGKVVDFQSKSEVKTLTPQPSPAPTFMPLFIPTK
ncbi:hypothetical protein D3874_14855 [Oleomonas cavernae]|uniref:Outer membrane protein assembly factor BamE n=1 Tax=Oleomonas cavernae TaxID=2320859 RepID=A0A418WDS1_9PROT|nr:hypothetical protein [Oleomonas cavernae]RJF88138.1 hypothetical protein D3874_14855 [Oleomonas cavernae]